MGGRLTGEASSVAYFTWTSADSGIVQFEVFLHEKVSGRNTVHVTRHIQIFSYNECKQTLMVAHTQMHMYRDGCRHSGTQLHAHALTQTNEHRRKQHTNAHVY